jgi:hypothetical protein
MKVKAKTGRARRGVLLEGQGYACRAYFGERAIVLVKDIAGRPMAVASKDAQSAQERVELAHRMGDAEARWFWAETVGGKEWEPPPQE